MRVVRTVMAGTLAALLTGGVAQAATLPQQSSVSSRLQDRREVSSGTRAYSVGFEDGNFYANGWHITGEMGGIWTPPLKLADGVWFGVGGKWVGPATRFTSGWGYTRYRLPSLDGLRLSRTDFSPDGRRAALFGLTLANPADTAKHTTVTVDAHSELMGAWPWGTDPGRGRPSAEDDLPDTGHFDGRALVFRDRGALPGGPQHDWAAVVGSAFRPRSGVTGPGHRGPQPGHSCASSDQLPPSSCDDGPYGHGTGGQLRYRVRVPARGRATLWITVAGSDHGLSAARREFEKTSRRPDRELARKIAARERLGRRSQVSLPGDRLLQRSIDWGKQNLADLTQSVRDLQIRWTNQGKQEFGPVLGTVKRATFFGAGFPDYPWLFATDGEYTSFAAVALGQFGTAEAHMRALRDVSVLLNGRDSGVVAHETVTDGSVYFGHDSSHTNADGTTTNDFNTDELVKFPSAVALIWRWTGDNRFRDDLYDFAVRTMHTAVERLDADGDGWPEGSGNVEVTGMGDEKLDNAVYLIRGLQDLADMARSKGDAATATWASQQADRRLAAFEAAWWDPAASQYADSLKDPGNHQLFQKFWIGSVPMEAELLSPTGRTTPGVAAFDHGSAAVSGREDPCFSGSRPYNRGMFHTGCNGGVDGKGDREIFTLNTAVQAVAEGNYGRLARGQQRRYTDANAETMLSEPATGGTPDEQPGAMPEIVPSPDFDRTGDKDKNIDRCWTCRSMVMQAWGNYGTAWPVIHQQLGVRPDLGNRRLEIVPQVPDGQPRVQGSDIRLGKGAADVLAARSGARLTTTVDVHVPGLRHLRIGQTLPRGSSVGQVTLDGRRVTGFRTVQTNRGVEVTVRVRGARGRHTLEVTPA